MPINGPTGVICVGETALILDGSLKGNSKLREVRHLLPERKERNLLLNREEGPADNGIVRRECAVESDH